LINSLQATLQETQSWVRRDFRVKDGTQEVTRKLWGSAEYPPVYIAVGEEVQLYNLQVNVYKHLISLNSTDETICQECSICHVLYCCYTCFVAVKTI